MTSRILRVSAGCLGILCCGMIVAGSPAQEMGTGEGQVDMAEMMQRARVLTTPGKNHALLERFLGEWETETRLVMIGSAAKPEAGTASFKWLLEGRWILYEASGAMMGMPVTTYSIMGYDNFKQSFVSVHVNTLDTAMLTSEGDLDPGGEVLISYGTLDEYLTGEHDKMVKYVWRFISDDKMIFEVHDLPIGEQDTKVFEVHYTRRSKSS